MLDTDTNASTSADHSGDSQHAQGHTSPNLLTLEHTTEVQIQPSPEVTFEAMGVRPEVLAALRDMGFRTPFAVQADTFRPILSGQDLIIQARTGSGKTAAFGIPILHQKIDPSLDVSFGKVQSLVLVPTRELALQVSGELEKISSHLPVIVTPLYGGSPMGTQLDVLAKGVHIVVGTPGRVLDHLRRGTLQLSLLKVLVLDEADEMFSRGFYEDISEIIKQSRKDRQTLLFSATMPYDVEQLCQRSMKHPKKIRISIDSLGTSTIEHSYYMVSGMARSRDLVKILDLEAPESAIIFCNTREETRDLTNFLRMQGFDAKSISGSLTQREREHVMSLMREHRLQFLIATDIAARGIDISHVTHVINFSFPESSEVYIHRTGRTGRAGRAGSAISLIGPRELGNFYTFKLTYKILPKEKSLPRIEDLQALREKQYLQRLHREIHRQPVPIFHSMVKTLAGTDHGERILAALLEQYVTTPLASDEVELSKDTTSVDSSLQSQQTSHDISAPIARSSLKKVESRFREHSGKEKNQDSSRQKHSSEKGSAPIIKSSLESKEHLRKSRSFRREDSAQERSVHPKEKSQGLGVGKYSHPKEEKFRENVSTQTQESELNPAGSHSPHYVANIEPIQITEGREYWEAWVDSRSAETTGSSAETGSIQTSVGEGQSSVQKNERESARPSRKNRTRKKPAPIHPEASASSEQTVEPESSPTITKEEASEHQEKFRAPRVYLNIGKRHGLNKERLSALLSMNGLAAFPAQIRITHSYLLPPEELIEQVVSALHGKLFEDRTLLCERARR